ncbi:unnamed protein product [Linum tenue]|uniref:Uncharacterized protein n=1 Tax=Linum tenue TaxID=586396 RepID=A0AAV0GTA8_9ROSI|nr:unnamed protein product [Linum tenue]
MGQSGTAGSSI